MAWTQPRTWVSGETVGAATMNTHVRDNLNALKDGQPPGLAGSPDIAGVYGAGTAEEWGTTTTGLTWTPSNPTTVESNVSFKSHLLIFNQADTTERIGTKSWAPGSGAFDAKLGGVYIGSASSAAAVTSAFGFVISSTSHTDRVTIAANYTHSTAVTEIKAHTYTGGSYTQRGSTFTIPSSLPIYFQITRDGSNNIGFLWSLNGRIWHVIASQAFTFTVANIGVRAVGNATGAFQAAADWLRTDV